MSKIFPAEHFSDEMAQEFADWLVKRTCQIIYIHPTTSEKEAIATGTLLNIEGALVIVTAAHVFTKENYDCLYIYTDTGAVQLSGIIYGSRLPNSTSTQPDPLDFAYILLDDKSKGDIKASKEFITWSHIQDSHISDATSTYIVFELPWRKTKIQKGRHGDIFASTVYFWTTGAGNAGYKDHNRRQHIVVRKFRKAELLSSGAEVTLPMLEGMSGGSLWYFPPIKAADMSLPAARLVGILCEYDSQFIYASNVVNIVDFIRKLNFHRL